MKTLGLIFVWLLMTAAFMFRFTAIEDIRSFITIYALLSLYLGCLAWNYKKKKEKQNGLTEMQK